MSRNTYPLTEVANQIAEVVASIVDTYEKELTLKLDDILSEVADDFMADLLPAIPVGEGHEQYGHLKEHLAKRKRTRKGFVIYEVYFKDKGFLSTLLEYGWTLRSGRFHQPYSNGVIRPVFSRNSEKYFKKIRNEAERQMAQT